MKKETNFGSHKFSAQEISDLIGISKVSFHADVRDGLISPKEEKKGAVTKKFYTWDDLLTLKNKYENRIPKPSKKVKVFSNLKGGVGKSSVSTNFAMRAASAGLKVLFIDADPQWNSTLAFGINSDEEDPRTLLSILQGDSFDDVKMSLCPTLDLIPSSLRLNKAERILRLKNNGQMQLKILLKEIIPQYDLIVIDTNPSVSFLNINAFLAADELCIVAETELFSVVGMNSMFEVIEELEDDYPDFSPSIRIIPNLFDVRESSCQMSIGVLRQNYDEYVTKATIRKSAVIKEAQNLRLPVFFTKRKSSGAEDFNDLTKELLNDKEESQ